MLVVEIEGVHTQAFEAGFTRSTDIFGFTAHTAKRRIGAIAKDGKFGGEKNLIAAIANGFTDEDFVVAIAVASAVSRKFMPSSMVRWMVAMDSSSLRAP
jgi:hypothetical protein